MIPYEIIKDMSLEEMANHHAMFAVVTIMAFCKEHNILYDVDWDKMIKDFTEIQMDLLSGGDNENN